VSLIDALRRIEAEKADMAEAAKKHALSKKRGEPTAPAEVAESPKPRKKRA
jgi:hypothetical protein